MKNTLKIALAFVAGAVLTFVGLMLVGNQSAQTFGAALGITRYPNSGIAARFIAISTTAGTATAGTDGSLSVGGGSSITVLQKCTSFTYNPSTFSSSTDATTTVAIAGPVVGDTLVATFATTTSGQDWHVRMPQLSAAGATASATIAFAPVIGSPAYFNGLNLATSTLSVCYTH